MRYQAAGESPCEAEPHIYGSRGGIHTLLVYNTNDGFWQALDVASLGRLEVLSTPFPGARPIPPEFDPDRQDVKPEDG